MKTIAAAAAVVIALTATAWADEPEQTQFELLKQAGEPIVLSETEMDGVTAGRHAQAAYLNSLDADISYNTSSSANRRVEFLITEQGVTTTR